MNHTDPLMPQDVNLDTLTSALRELADRIDDGEANIRGVSAKREGVVGEGPATVDLSVEYVLADLDDPLATPVQFDRWDQQGGESA